MTPGWTTIELTSFGTTLRGGAVSFFVHGAIVVSALVPTAGPTVGGTRVAVLGSGFVRLADFQCHFFLAARPRPPGTSARRVECASPPSIATGASTVELTLNGQQYTSNGATFTYLPETVVSSVWPTQSLSEGGTPLTVYGSGCGIVGGGGCSPVRLGETPSCGQPT